MVGELRVDVPNLIIYTWINTLKVPTNIFPGGMNHNHKYKVTLKLDHLALPLLVSTQFEMFCSFDWNLVSRFAR